MYVHACYWYPFGVTCSKYYCPMNCSTVQSSAETNLRKSFRSDKIINADYLNLYLLPLANCEGRLDNSLCVCPTLFSSCYRPVSTGRDTVEEREILVSARIKATTAKFPCNFATLLKDNSSCLWRILKHTLARSSSPFQMARKSAAWQELSKHCDSSRR